MPLSATLAARNARILAATLSSAEAAAGRSLLDIALAEDLDPAVVHHSAGRRAT